MRRMLAAGEVKCINVKTRKGKPVRYYGPPEQ